MKIKVTKKQKIILYILLLVFVGFVSFSISLYIKNSIKISTIACDKDNPESADETKLSKITCKQYNNIIKGKKQKIVLLGKPTCSYSNKMTKVFEKIESKYDINIQYLDLNTLSLDELSEFHKSSELFNINDFGTPTLVVIKNGKIRFHAMGYFSEKEIVKWLKTIRVI